MRRVIRWKMDELIRVIVATLLNKYDFFLVIEGGTGIGKSTLAWHICKGISREFKRLYDLKIDHINYYYERVGKALKMTEEEFLKKILDLRDNQKYRFKPHHDLVYNQDAMQKGLASWNRIIIPDEMINVTFNRDFTSQKQKDIVKMINMFRDHCNVIIACVPYFQTLDNQIKNLCKMKITVKKRGTGIIHTPNSIVYSKDKWDQATNEKIEKEWIIKKIQHPNYAKLTTFRGVVRFPAMSKKEEKLYQSIKDKKRAVILKDDMKIDVKEAEKSTDPVDMMMERLIKGGVKNSAFLEGFAEANGMSVDQLRSRIQTKLKQLKMNPSISTYYWDKKARNEDSVAQKEQFHDMISA